MSDIVERLKKVEAVERELAHECDMPPEGTANWEYAEACAEAAAEIERLRAALRDIIADSYSVYAIGVARAALGVKMMYNTPEKPDSSAIVHSLIPPDWDNGPYNVASELKRLLASVSDYGSSIDSGTMDGQAHLWATIGGIEYFITVERASGQSKRSLCLEEIDRLRLALEAAADRMFDAGLNDAWADARAALKEDGDA